MKDTNELGRYQGNNSTWSGATMAQYNKSKDFDPFDIADLQFSETSRKMLLIGSILCSGTKRCYSTIDYCRGLLVHDYSTMCARVGNLESRDQ